MPLTIDVVPIVSAPAAGADHVPSPRQNVDDEALVPLLRFVTGRLPVTPLARLICAQAGAFDVPVLERYRVAFVSLARDAKVFSADA